MLTTGQKLWNGATVTPSLAAAYNSIQARIASFTDNGTPAPEYLLNGAHNLINSVMPDSQDSPYDALRALDVPAMTACQIYAMRDVIGNLAESALWDAREYQDYAETRARGHIQRGYIESVKLRLAAVTRP